MRSDDHSSTGITVKLPRRVLPFIGAFILGGGGACAHAPVRLLCYRDPVCVREDDTLWRCSCPSLDEEYPTPGEQRWYVEVTR